MLARCVAPLRSLALRPPLAPPGPLPAIKCNERYKKTTPPPKSYKKISVGDFDGMAAEKPHNHAKIC